MHVVFVWVYKNENKIDQKPFSFLFYNRHSDREKLTMCSCGSKHPDRN